MANLRTRQYTEYKMQISNSDQIPVVMEFLLMHY